MTGPQLRTLRGKRTREEFAEFLGDCSASTVNNWEREVSPVPQWVAEKALRGVKMEIELGDLQELLDEARDKKTSFKEILGEAIQDYIAKRRKDKTSTMRDHRAVASTMLVDTPGEYKTPKAKRREA